MKATVHAHIHTYVPQEIELSFICEAMIAEVWLSGVSVHMFAHFYVGGREETWKMGLW